MHFWKNSAFGKTQLLEAGTRCRTYYQYHAVFNSVSQAGKEHLLNVKMDEVVEKGQACQGCKASPGEEGVDGSAVALDASKNHPSKAYGPD